MSTALETPFPTLKPAADRAPVSLRHVSKQFGPVTAVQDVDIRIGPSEIVAFLGGARAGAGHPRAALPGVRVLIVTTFGRPGFLRRAMEAGAGGFVVKTCPPASSPTPSAGVHAGLPVMDPSLAADSVAAGSSRLTPASPMCIAQLGRTGSVAEIASAVHLSEGTVRNHLSATIGKTMVCNRADAARIADDNGWL